MPVPQIQFISQSRTSGHVFQAYVKQLGSIESEAHLDVAQRFTPDQLRKRHNARYIGAIECADVSATVVTFNDATKGFSCSVFIEIQIADARKPVQTHIDIVFAGDEP